MNLYIVRNIYTDIKYIIGTVPQESGRVVTLDLGPLGKTTTLVNTFGKRCSLVYEVNCYCIFAQLSINTTV